MTGVKGGTAQMPSFLGASLVIQEGKCNLSTAMPGRSKHLGVGAHLLERESLQGCSGKRINTYMSGSHKRGGG